MRRPENPPELSDTRPPVAWDARPVKKFVKGQVVEFFTIGALALALGKSVKTVRRGIHEGYLPQATYRMPTVNNVAGKRLYLRAQIEAIVKVADAHGLLGSTYVRWIDHPTLADEIRQAWRDIDM